MGTYSLLLRQICQGSLNQSRSCAVPLEAFSPRLFAPLFVLLVTVVKRELSPRQSPSPLVPVSCVSPFPQWERRQREKGRDEEGMGGEGGV